MVKKELEEDQEEEAEDESGDEELEYDEEEQEEVKRLLYVGTVRWDSNENVKKPTCLISKTTICITLFVHFFVDFVQKCHEKSLISCFTEDINKQ